MVGFELAETLAGRLRFDRTSAERALTITIHARSGPIPRFFRQPKLNVEGAIHADGLASHRPLAGSIEAASSRAVRCLAYRFTFVGDDGETYAFAGTRSILDGRLFPAFTVLLGAIRDGRGELVGEALLRFDTQRDLGALVKSFRVVREGSIAYQEAPWALRR